MFRTKLSPTDQSYTYSNSFENIVYSNERHPNPYQEFFDLISDIPYAKEHLEEMCGHINGIEYYENDVLIDTSFQQLYFVQKDIFNRPIFFTHNFSSINAFDNTMFSIESVYNKAEINNDMINFIEKFKEIKNGTIYVNEKINLTYDGERFVSDRFYTSFKGKEISFDVFSDYDDNAPFTLSDIRKSIPTTIFDLVAE